MNGGSGLLVAFVKYKLSKLYSHCNQNCNFYYFLGTITSVLKQIVVQYLFRLVYLFSPKTSKNDSWKYFIKFFWTASDTLCHLVYIVFPLISIDLILGWRECYQFDCEISVSFAGFLLCYLCLHFGCVAIMKN